MACVRKEFSIHASADTVWAAVRDVGAAHTRVFPRVLTDVRVEGNARVVTFANGLVVRELIVDLDDDRRRFAYAAVGGRTTHHNASIEVQPEGADKCRVVWITDLLPSEMAPPISDLVERGAAAMTKTLESIYT
jgi:carbon monoxide dehydrogenase subunit G